jgi:pSer/pThr/pTyr-binding forkhead associated (FHA) protein
MNETLVEPRLVTVTGPLSGEVFSLAAATVTFGRDPSNTIAVADPALSRHHCIFSKDDQGWTLRDAGSSNGTFVNGLQVATHRLVEGDRISAGGSVLLFVRASPSGVANPDLVDGGVLAATSTLASDQTVYLNPAASRSASRVEQGLRALLSISTIINAVRSEQELRRELLRVLRDVIPFE